MRYMDPEGRLAKDCLARLSYSGDERLVNELCSLCMCLRHEQQANASGMQTLNPKP